MKKALKRGDDGTLNVYTTSGGDFLGWAYLPEITDTAQAYLDGIVIDWRTVPGAPTTYAGRFDEGDTLTHEAGHWLNLEHTFYGHCNKTGDFVDDTPPQKSPSSGCPEGKDTCRAAGTRSDPQLHGLLRRRLHHGVHAGAVAADGRRLAVLPGELRLAAAPASTMEATRPQEPRHEDLPRHRRHRRDPHRRPLGDPRRRHDQPDALRQGRGASYEDILREVCSITPGPVSAEVVADDVEGMLEEGRASSPSSRRTSSSRSR